jgi:hypothetical protein
VFVSADSEMWEMREQSAAVRQPRGGWPRLLALTLLSRVARPSFAWAGFSEAPVNKT